MPLCRAIISHSSLGWSRWLTVAIALLLARGTLCAAASAFSHPAARPPALEIRLLPVSDPDGDASVTVHVASAGVYRSFEGTISTLEQGLFDDAQDGRLDKHTLFEAALIAGGERSPADLDRYRARMAAWVGKFRKSAASDSDSPREQVRRLFEFLHARVFHGGYRIDATDLAATLDEGRYNCVSATVLFLSIAPEALPRVEACALEVPGHAMIRVRLSDGVCDVESTCAEWFQLTNDPAKRAALVRKAMRGAQPDSDKPVVSREVSPVELVAMIYYNRGVDLLGQKRFDEAMSANAKSLRLAPGNATARGNLLATINNGAIALGAEGEFRAAAKLLQKGLAVDPSYAAFHANLLHVYRRWLETSLAGDRWIEAVNVATTARQILQQPGVWRDVEANLVQRRIRELLDASPRNP
jgi:tetratricopeptide (TPR) repeat protein